MKDRKVLLEFHSLSPAYVVPPRKIHFLRRYKNRVKKFVALFYYLLQYLPIKLSYLIQLTLFLVLLVVIVSVSVLNALLWVTALPKLFTVLYIIRFWCSGSDRGVLLQPDFGELVRTKRIREGVMQYGHFGISE